MGCSAGAYFMLLGAELHEPILKMERWLTARTADVDHATLWDTGSDVLGLYGSKDNRDLLRELPGTFHAFEVIVLQQPGRLLDTHDLGTLVTNFSREMRLDQHMQHIIDERASQIAPLVYVPPLPRLRLPLNIISVALITLAQLLRYEHKLGSTTLALSLELQRLREENEYLLQLVEADSFAEWRTNLRRPASLPPLPSPMPGPVKARRAYADPFSGAQAASNDDQDDLTQASPEHSGAGGGAGRGNTRLMPSAEYIAEHERHGYSISFEVPHDRCDADTKTWYSQRLEPSEKRL
jgi:hypothetical protein